MNHPYRPGHANITARRRFAIGIVKTTSRDTVFAAIQRLARNARLMLASRRTTENSRLPPGRLTPLG